MSTYPTRDIEQQSKGALPAAVIASVQEDSPAYDAGFEPGCKITAVNGQPLRDIIDWRWQTSDDEITLSYIDLDGEEGTIDLERFPGEDWGFEFEGVVFDKIKLCRNACTFCFMRQLPAGLRPSLSLRDDDYRLSFLSGTFVTMTNISPEDEARIVDQRISPLRVSLHAVSPDVRQKLIGKHAQHGLDVIDRLLAQGIEMHVQIVLVPNSNDGEELKRTLEWAYARPGIVEIGIVPLGFTRHQSIFNRSFNKPSQAKEVLDLIAPFQKKAKRERGSVWVYAADEFYRNAYTDHLLEHLPRTSFYGDFGMFEDGVGIIRSVVDDWEECVDSGLTDRCAQHLRERDARAVLLAGYAMMPFFGQLVEASVLKDLLLVLPVENGFFSGNVDVTGLLTAADVAQAVSDPNLDLLPNDQVIIPNVVLNDDGVMLDDGTLEDVFRETGVEVISVSCNPSGFLAEIMELV